MLEILTINLRGGEEMDMETLKCVFPRQISNCFVTKQARKTLLSEITLSSQLQLSEGVPL